MFAFSRKCLQQRLVWSSSPTILWDHRTRFPSQSLINMSTLDIPLNISLRISLKRCRHVFVSIHFFCRWFELLRDVESCWVLLVVFVAGMVVTWLHHLGYLILSTLYPPFIHPLPILFPPFITHPLSILYPIFLHPLPILYPIFFHPSLPILFSILYPSTLIQVWF